MFLNADIGNKEVAETRKTPRFMMNVSKKKSCHMEYLEETKNSQQTDQDPCRI